MLDPPGSFSRGLAGFRNTLAIATDSTASFVRSDIAQIPYVKMD
jgi:hypothetical protein